MHNFESLTETVKLTWLENAYKSCDHRHDLGMKLDIKPEMYDP